MFAKGCRHGRRPRGEFEDVTLSLAVHATQAVGAAAVGAGIRSSDQQAEATATPVQPADWQALSVRPMCLGAEAC